MSLDAELNMCLLKNCLTIYFMRRNLLVIIVISKEQWPLHVHLSPSCLLARTLGVCSCPGSHTTVLPPAAFPCRNVGKS